MVEELIHKLRGLNVKVNLVGEQLDVRAPKGVMNEALMQEIRLHKEELISFVKKSHAEEQAHVDIRPVEKQSSYPLSSAQRRLWILCQFADESIAYNMPSQVMLRGINDMDSFRKAVISTVERHESLRTVFIEDEQEEIRQSIIPAEEMAFEIDYRDYRGWDDQARLVESYIAHDSTTAFDLRKGPLFRTALLQLADDQCVFYFNIHHIISDGWSMNVLRRDIMSYYEAYKSSAVPGLQPLKIQYKDYAVWQQANVEKTSFQKHKKYWLDVFAGEIPLLNLPAQKRRPVIKTTNGRTLATYIKKETTQALKQFCADREGSLFMGLLAALNVVFHKYTLQHEFVVGSPVAGRDHVSLEDQIGFYLNTIALKNAVLGTDTLETLFSRVKKNVFDAYEHQQYPFDRLVEELELKRDPARSPVFDVMLILQNISDIKSAVEQSAAQIIDQGEEKSKYDLSFTFYEVGDQLSMHVNFNTDVYETEMITGFMQHFKNTVAHALVQPELVIEKLSVISGEEHDFLRSLAEGEVVPVPENDTLITLFEKQAAATPEATALVFEGTEMSYKELDSLSIQLAHYLSQHFGVTGHDILGARLERTPHAVVALLAALRLGACCAPLSVDTPEEKLHRIGQHCRAVIDDTDISRFLADKDQYPSENPEYVGKQSDAVYIIYTSGSTGIPKGVVLNHHGIINHLMDKITLLSITKGTKICHTSRMHFVGGIWQLWAPLISGGTVLLTTDTVLQDISVLLDTANHHGVRVLEVIPSQLNMLFAIGEEGKLAQMDDLILTGEKLTPSYVNKFFTINPQVRIYNTYGMTEYSDVATTYKIDAVIKDKILIGRPIQNTQVYVMDSNSNLCPVGVIGELCISGHGVSAGYLGEELLTSEKFVAHPLKQGQFLYRTGDLGRWTAAGELEVLGRRDHQVSIRGYRVELMEIENALQAHPLIQDVTVMAGNIDAESAVLIAYLTKKDKTAELTVSAIRSYLKTLLHEYMIPAYFVELDALPLLANGKVNKKELPDPRTASMKTGVEFVAPKSDMEKVLAAELSRLLNRKEINVKDNFYEAGGDSIKLIRLLSGLRKQGYMVKPELILKARDIAHIAALIDERQQADTSVPDNRKIAVNTRQWKPGDEIAISENQRQMLKFDKSQGIIGSYSLPRAALPALESSFRAFLQGYPMLCMTFFLTAEGIYQRLLTAEEVPLEIVLKKLDFSDPRNIMVAERDIFNDRFDLLGGALMRLYVFEDETQEKALLNLAISHSLTDMRTNEIIRGALSDFITGNKPTSDTVYVPHFDFSIWQEQYLQSGPGRASRQFWTDRLKTIGLSPGSFYDKTEYKYINQRVQITGEKFMAIRNWSRKFNAPLSVIFMNIHQYLLKKLSKDEIPVQLILVNGRDNVSDDIDISHVLGVLNNFLPMKVLDRGDDVFARINESIYAEYLWLREHQSVPYEKIRKDFMEATGMDLDRCRMASINYQEINDNIRLNTTDVEIESVEVERAVFLDMVCKVAHNCVQLTITVPDIPDSSDDCCISALNDMIDELTRM
ncbi:non-ribosomal peptide synthetase [Chitinophaga sp. HK235]|uniref:non-ribosomal peptide synthetase n=1 Tax=Chitinophaga sp. HK235 TaxID=2952571 RepID=UPI001BA6A78F|nr:non-ribosomal peptide synthetase [Chitinophaga sp. HK235]